MCELERIFGFQREIKGGIVFFKPTTIFYITGQTGIFHNLVSDTQKFIRLPQKNDFSAMTLGVNNVLALASKGQEPNIMLHNLKTHEKILLPHPESLNCKEYLHLSFSKDDEFVAAHGSAPSWPFVLWHVKKLTVSVPFFPFRPEQGAEVFKFAFHPEDHTTVVAVGKFFLRMYFLQKGNRFREETFHNLERSNTVFHSVAWMQGPNTFAVGTSDGLILIFQRRQLLTKITVCDKLAFAPRVLQFVEDPDDRNIRCLMSTRKGFICSYGRNSVLCLHKKIDEWDFEIKISVHIPEQEHIESTNVIQIILNSNEDTLVASTEDGRILVFFFAKIKALEHTGYNANFEVIMEQQLNSRLVGADTAAFKAFHVSCSTSGLILWHYLERKILQQRNLYAGIKSISIHPLGFNILVGYDTGAKVFNVLNHRIDELWEFDTRISQVCFSKEGHMMAISNRKTIELYSSLSLKKFGELKGHQENIFSMVWRNLDSHLLSVCKSGKIIEWDIPTAKMVWSYADTSAHFTKIAASKDSQAFYSATLNCRIWMFRKHKKSAEAVTSENVTFLLETESLLLTGTGNGSVIGYRLPLSSNLLFEISCHRGMILNMALISNRNSLLVTGEDGATSVWKISDISMAETSTFLDEVLENRTEYEASQKKLKDMENELKEEEIVRKKKKDKLLQEQEEEIQKIKQKYQDIQKQLKDKIIDLTKENYEMQLNPERRRLKKAKQTVRDIEENKADCKEKLQQEEEYLEKLKQERSKMITTYEKKIEDLKEKVRKAEDRMNQQLEQNRNTLVELQSHIQKEEQKCCDLEKEHTDHLLQWEIEAKQKSEEIRLQLASELEKTKNENQENDNEIKKIRAVINYEKECSRSLDAEFVKKEKMYDKLKEIMQQIKLRIEHVSKEVEMKENELKEKVDMVKVLENDAKEFEHMSSEANLKIQECKELLVKKDEELLNVITEKDQIETTMKNLIRKLKSKQREQKLLEEKLQFKEKNMEDCTQKLLNTQLLLESYRNEFMEAIKNVEGTNELRWAFLELVNRRASESRIKDTETFAGDTDPYIKFCRQRDHYESLINTVLNRKQDIQSSFRSTYVKLAKENSDWTAFVDALRLGLQQKLECIRILEEAVGMTAEDFMKDPAETQKMFNKVYNNLKSVEQDEQEEIRKRLDLIKEQEKEIQRLHGLLVVEEKGKITRKVGH